MSTAIETTDLAREFASVRAVDGISFTVDSGTIFGFLGPNGAGKTTTIRLLLGLLEPTRGDARVLGLDVRTDAAGIRAASGVLLEHPGLYERMTAEDNLEFVGRIWRFTAAERRARIRELLEPLGLFDRRRETVAGWSRGMKQKLAVARALFHRPALVFLDEPTAGLDPVAAAALRDDLVALVRSAGVTVFLTTHNLVEADRVCDRVAVIRAGRIVDMGRPSDLRERASGRRMVVTGWGFTADVGGLVRADPGVASVEVGDGRLTIGLRDGADTSAIVPLLVRAGVVIDEVRKGTADLEEAFLTLVEGDPGPGSAGPS